jgi:hypothetical protein
VRCVQLGPSRRDTNPKRQRAESYGLVPTLTLRVNIYVMRPEISAAICLTKINGMGACVVVSFWKKRCWQTWIRIACRSDVTQRIFINLRIQLNVRSKRG